MNSTVELASLTIQPFVMGYESPSGINLTIMTLRAEGVALETIGQTVGLSRGAVRNRLERMGLAQDLGLGATYTRQKQVGMVRKKYFCLLLGGRCFKCGYSKNLAAMEFHHRDPATKLFGITVQKLHSRTMAALKAEVEKCDLLCSNCHAERHYPDSEWDGTLDAGELVGRLGLESS